MQSTKATGATALFEDAGTNSGISLSDRSKDPPDTDDAANFGQAFRAYGLSNRVSFGLTFENYDGASTPPTVDITRGAAAIDAPSAFAAKAGRTRQDVSYPVRIPAQPSVPLEANTQNELWVHLPLTGNDEVRLIARDVATDPVPNQPALKIGSVDTATATSAADVTLHSRGAILNLKEIVGGMTDGVSLRSFVDGDFAINQAGALVFDSSGGADLSDADTLGGDPPSYYAAVEENETITGAWTFQNGLTTAGDVVDGAGNTVYDHSAGVVPSARLASDVDAATVKGNDIDTDGDGIVDQADLADDAVRLGGIQPGNYARTDVGETFDDGIFIDTHGFGGGPAQIGVAVGDNDTGLDSTTDGELQVYANNDIVGRISNATGADFTTLKEANERVETRQHASETYRSGTVLMTGSVTLSGGSGRITTGSANSRLNVDLEIDGSSVSGDCTVGARLIWDNSAGSHDIEIVEQGTAQDPRVRFTVWED
ncbi:hypothetical protein [Halomarina oriensis]|uniref:Uncharacterized protein n=1 Tax=Halomarina oriensis TaxID=671145 RepID=A0A6B0GS94_9EURY|nr:hypothetical protein [Halomarina oriensis]MWG36569.1 hypothetical protein [Halomarina oriensis]